MPEINITEDDIIPSHQAALYAIQHQDVDIRPRYHDKLTNTYSLVDTGAQVSCCPPSPGDTIDPNVFLEAVDGSSCPPMEQKPLH